MGPQKREKHAKRKEFRNNILFKERAEVKTGDYELREMKMVLNKMKNKKAPGPDGIRIEFFKYLNDENLRLVLKEINGWRKDGSLPKNYQSRM